VNALSAEEHRVRDIEARIEKLSRHGKAQAGVIKAARSEVATLKEAAAALSSAATTAATTAAHPAAASKAGDRGGRGTGTGGAFAVLANNDWGSVASAMAVVDMLRQYRTRFDVLVVTPEPLDPHFASQVRRLRATPVSLGHTTYVKSEESTATTTPPHSPTSPLSGTRLTSSRSGRRSASAGTSSGSGSSTSTRRWWPSTATSSCGGTSTPSSSRSSTTRAGRSCGSPRTTR